MKKRFIEYDLPLAEISEQSAREKNVRHGHPATLHVWWARRPLASSRATALAALLDDPGAGNPVKRDEVRRLIESVTPWEAVTSGGTEALRTAQRLISEQYGGPPEVTDPFSGGGSIPLETLRLGCRTYATDYNPVAVFVERLTLEWPQRFGLQVEFPPPDQEGRSVPNAGVLFLGSDSHRDNLLAALVERWAKRIQAAAKAEIGRFYPEESVSPDQVAGGKPKHKSGWIPVGYMWARTIPCQNPTCGAEIPLISSFWLRKKKGMNVVYRPGADRLTRRVDFQLLDGDALDREMESGFNPGAGTVNNGHASCLICGQVTRNNQVRAQALEGQMRARMTAVVLRHPKQKGKLYRLASEADEALFNEAAAYLDSRLAAWPHLEQPIPDEQINPKRPSPNARGLSGLTRFGLTSFGDLFNRHLAE